MSDIEIYNMTEEDVPFIAQVEKECFSEPWSEKAIRDELNNESALFFVAKKEGSFLGYIGMHTVVDECYIANIAVMSACRRQGVGDVLLKHGENAAKQRGCSFISLEVRVSNLAAKSLYEKHGYTVQGERKNFYREPTENALIMTKYFNEE